MQAISRNAASTPMDYIHPTTGLRYAFSYFLGKWDYDGSKDPFAVLVEFPNPNGTLLAHFHDVDQFQIVVQGDGKVGRHPLGKFGIHYTDAFTTYGPIHAGAEGISFFTIRTERGAPPHYMPQSRGMLSDRKRGREITCQISLEHAGGSDAGGVRTLIAPHVDGLAASLMDLPAGAGATGFAPGAGAGQYYLVLSGSLQEKGQELPAGSLAFVPPDDEAAPGFSAGTAGARLLYLQLPKRRPQIG